MPTAEPFDARAHLDQVKARVAAAGPPPSPAETGEILRLRARVAELEAENTAVDQGRPEALDQLLAAVAQALPEQTPEERAEWAERNYRRAHRVAVRATKRVDELAERCVHLESDAPLVAAQRRADAAEAQVAAVREAIRRELGNRRTQGRVDLGEYGRRILAALDAAGTPAAEPHTGHDCPNRIEVTSWGMTDREWICGCDPRPDATAPAETPSPSEAP